MQPPGIPVSAINEPLRVSGKYFRAGEEVCFVKAVTFGPFPAGVFPDEGRMELRRIREELGANAIRLYELPTLDFMHDCAELEIRVFITLPWTQHIDFLNQRSAIVEADQQLIETVRKFRGHPALAGYFVANEIETTLVRWMRPKRVIKQIERMIALGKANDPDALFAYANYPSTEYLLPSNQDFVGFNLYLESPETLGAYLARLQNLAGNLPLLITEFGSDSKSHGELTQAGMLEWHLEEACRSGVAGTTIFSWSDLWRRGGKEIVGWDFGLTRRDHSAKPSLEVVREKWTPVVRPGDVLDVDGLPSISVVICTYRGSATLVECLDSLEDLDYPDYEVVVVNDSSDQRVEEISLSYEYVRLFQMPHEGLSSARNIGAAEAKGEIIVYIDDDCRAELDWLKWIGIQFRQRPGLGCAGGPNIPPSSENMRQAVIAAAPGGPTHVLLTDNTAEHLPGCNLAVRKKVLEEVGGFNERFWTAGDDVDFCWRVIDAGYDLGFHPAAFVWHHRRFTMRAFVRQQIGYGRAETMLTLLHQERFGECGATSWRGRVYDSGAPGGQTVYHGRYGYEPFQLVYEVPGSGIRDLSLHIGWWAGIVATAVVGGFFWPSSIVAALMLIITAVESRRRAVMARLEPAYDSPRARWWLAWLILLQGAVRSGARLRFGWRKVNPFRGVGAAFHALGRKLMSGWWKLGIERTFWSEEGIGRDQLLEAVLKAFPGAMDDESGATDIIVKDSLFWNWAVVTVTEFHGDGKQLTRLRLLARPKILTRVLALLTILLIPAAVTMGIFGEINILILLLAIYLVGHGVARMYMWLKRPRLSELARSVGLKSS